MTQASIPHDIPSLDQLTGGAFTAPTSGERAQRVRDWLASDPSPEQMQAVFKELSGRDKGAARALRERLDEIKRAKGQEAIAAEWAGKAEALLGQPKLNIADAMAWQRDAAKAGAPLSREPLAGFKARIAERIKGIEDLQHRAQVHREASVLLAQRFEVLSTKPWQDAQAAEAGLRNDVQHWLSQAQEITQDANWGSLDARFAPQLEASKAQLNVVSDAFHSALAQTAAAAADAQAPLPPVPVWADEIRAARGIPLEAAEPAPAAPPAPKVDPAARSAAEAAVQTALDKLEKETAEGHGKASQGAAAALRAMLKEHGRLVGGALEARVHAALVAAGELEGWQRWSADKVREELVAKAEGLLNRPEGQALGGRKMQEQLRALREQWKKVDQGGAPNHALWKRFDEACNQAHKVVEAWLDKVRADAAEHRAQRLALVEELKAWTAAQPQGADEDLKARNRALHQFADRWRDAGHVSEKTFGELQPLWNAALAEARAPLEAAQKASLERRHQLIAEANELGAAPTLRIDAVKTLQQRWQAEAQSVPLDRRQEQKLWDAFRKPIDEAFQRKSAERERVAAAMSEHDRAVLDASKALEAANAGGDAQQIRAAMAQLEAALRGQRLAGATGEGGAPAKAAPGAAATVPDVEGNAASAGTVPAGEGDAAPGATPDASATGEGAPAADESASTTAAAAAPSESGAAGDAPAGESTDAPAAEAAPAPKPAPRPVVAVRGDDRPGAQRPATPAAGGGRFGDRRDGRDSRGGDRPGRGGADRRGPGDRDRGGRFGDRPPREERGPRLGDAAFRAQREAMDHAQLALRKLAAQAQGEVLSHLVRAWEQRDAAAVPPAQELGRAVTASVRSRWTQALSDAPATDTGRAGEALLRLEMAADVPTPADQLDARRALQLQLLTRRNEAGPAETWTQDASQVLASPHDADRARRLQNALRVLLRKS